MPYIAMDGNRYLAEHSCGKYHYGNQAMIRQCCIDDCAKYAQLAVDKAMTMSHPAYQVYVAAWNSLTDAERAIAPDLTYSLNDGFRIKSAA